MSNYEELDNFEKAAVHQVKLDTDNREYTDEEFFKYNIDGYHCEDDRRAMRKVERKLRTFAERMKLAKKFDLI